MAAERPTISSVLCEVMKSPMGQIVDEETGFRSARRARLAADPRALAPGAQSDREVVVSLANDIVITARKAFLYAINRRIVQLGGK